MGTLSSCCQVGLGLRSSSLGDIVVIDLSGQTRPVIIIGLVGQTWGRHKIKDKISKDELKSVFAPIRCGKESLSRKAGAAGGRHGVGAVIAVLEVAGARPEADIVELY